TCSDLANAAPPAAAFWPVPATALMVAGTAVLVKVNVAGLMTPPTTAVTLKLPLIWLAVKAGAVAIPSALVGTIGRALKLPAAPLGSAVKLIDEPLTGFPNASRTCTSSGTVKAAPEAAL